MKKRSFYVFALYACQVKPEREEDRGGMMLWPMVVVADTEERAREMGIEAAKKEYPESEGWGNYAATANTVKLEQLVKIVEDLLNDDGDDDPSGEPVM
jgi:hypothetical protein